MNRSTPGLHAHHQLLEFTQTHIHWVSDAIQPSHPLSFPSPPAPNPSQLQRLFQWVKLFAWGGQSTGVSAVASFLPKKSQGWSPSEWTGIISYKYELPVQVQCRIQEAWGWCTGMTQRDGNGREVGGGFRMGNMCTPVADACWCMAKPIQYCKVKINK